MLEEENVLTEHVKSFQAMGSPFMIRIDIRPDRYSKHIANKVNIILEQLQVHIELAEECMSRFRKTSELTWLNLHVAQDCEVSPRLKQVLLLAEEMHRLTDGVFDPRILRNMEQIGYSGVPVQRELRQSLLQPQERNADQMNGLAYSSQLLQHSSLFSWNGEHTVRISHPIDLGGIGKGHTADMTADQIEASFSSGELAGYIVDAGGDLVAAGYQASGEPWSIGVENPFEPDSLGAALTLPIDQRTAVCTSSIWKKSWKHEGVQVHHLIDPFQGKSMDTSYMSVTVMSDKAAVAESIAKYIFLRGFPEASSCMGISWAAAVVDREQHFICTPSAEQYVSWTSPQWQSA